MTATYDLFQHDWGAQVKLEWAYRTQVGDADSVGEERTQLWDRPSRLISCRWVAVDAYEAARIAFHLARAGTDPIRVPLYCDQAVTTATSVGTTINCPTAYRRFQVGKLVAIHKVGPGGRANTAQYRTIDAVGGASLTVSPALTGSYPAGALVYPVLVTEVTLAPPPADFVTDEVAVVDGEFRELHGDDALGPLVAGGLDTLGTFPTATVEGVTHNVFDTEPEWGQSVPLAFVRPGEDQERGRGRTVYARGTRPLWRWSIALQLEERADAWEVLEFLDNQRGITGVFWYPFPGKLFTAVGYATGFVEIEPLGNIADLQELFTHVAVEFDDGTYAIRRIDDVTVVGGAWRIDPTEDFPAGTLADVAKVSPCILARLETDAIEEHWDTDEVCSLEFTVREVLNEAAVESVSAPEECA